MAFVGNDMFGHHLHMAAQSGNSGGFGQGGFGKSSHGSQSTFGPSSKAGHGHDHSSGGGGHSLSGTHIGAYGVQHGIYGRKNSVLTDMTTSKKDRENNQWMYSHHSIPGHQHHGDVTSIYVKPMEKPAKPVLVKQQSMSVADTPLSRMRAPSLSSDPIGMRSRTISMSSTASAPKRLTRSMSLMDDITAPANMDLARPIMKRQQTIEDAKARKRSQSLMNPKKSLLPHNLMQRLKNRRSSKGLISDNDSQPSTPNSHRSRSSTMESKRIASEPGVIAKHEPEVTERSLSEPKQRVTEVEDKSAVEDKQAAVEDKPQPIDKQGELILSLLGPPQPPEDEDAVFLGDPDIMDDLPNTTVSQPRKTDEVEKMNFEANTLQLRKVHGGSYDTEDNTSMQSGKFTPRSISSNVSRGSSKDSPVSLYNQPLLDQTDDNEHTSMCHPDQFMRPISPLTILTNQINPDETVNSYKTRPESPIQPISEPLSRRSSESTVPRSSTSSLPSPKLFKNSDSSRLSPKLYADERIPRVMVSEASNTSPSLFRAEKPKKLPMLLIPNQQNRYYTYCPGKRDGKLVMYIDPSDSESSESYYDCSNHQSDSGSPRQYRQDNALVPKRGKRRHFNRPKQAQLDAESTNLYEDDTDNEQRHVKDIVRHLEKSKSQPQHIVETDTKLLKPQFNSFNEMMKSKRSKCKSPIQIQIARPYHNIVIPQYAQELKAEYESKDVNSNDTGTTTSIESGYVTSHLQPSPREYNNQKVLQFVNSLPNNPEMEESISRSSHGDYVKNGSVSENDSTSDIEPNSPVSDMSGIRCVSGSDTDNYSLNSDISMSRLEVMKILPSPTDVMERVNSELAKRSNRSSPAISEPARAQKYDPNLACEPMKYASSVRRNQDGSQTELLKLCGNDVTDNMSEVDEQVVMRSARPHSSARTSESRLNKHSTSRYSASSYSHRFFDQPMTSFRSNQSGYNKKLTNCIDLVLHILNTVLFLASIGVLSIGIWLLLKDFNVFQVSIILDNNLLELICYIAIAGAGNAFLAATCLCCGIRKDKFGLGFYAFVLVLVVCAFTTAAVLSAIFADKLYGVEFRFNFKDRLLQKYGNVEAEDHVDNEFFTKAWDKMQTGFKCCGAEGNVNDSKSWALYKKFSIWYRLNPLKATKYVPESCCKEDANKEVCQGSDHHLLGPPVYGPMIELGNSVYNEVNPHLNTDGCFGPVASHLSTIATWSALTLGILAGLYFITVMLTWVFCFKHAQGYSESYLDDSYYDLEYLNDNLSEYSEHDQKHRKHAVNPNNEEETKFLSTPVTVENPVDEHDTYDVQLHAEDPLLGKYKEDLSDPDNESEHSADMIDAEQVSFTKRFCEDIEECNEESDSSNESGEKGGINRRNNWLESEARAVHLLSIAIQEEDSNVEDTDEENDENSAFV